MVRFLLSLMSTLNLVDFSYCPMCEVVFYFTGSKLGQILESLCLLQVFGYKDRGSLTKFCWQIAFLCVDLDNSQSLCIDILGDFIILLVILSDILSVLIEGSKC